MVPDRAHGRQCARCPLWRAGAKALWLQLGSWHEDVALKAEAAGVIVVMDRCVKIEHAGFHGCLHLAGFDTGVIFSRRQVLA